MTTMAEITKFLEQKTLAVVGVSRSPNKFSNRLYKSLRAKGYRLFAVNPNTDQIDGEACFGSIQALPQKVSGAVILVPPKQTEKVVRAAAAAGIKHIWIQQGAESHAAIDFCKQNGMNVIHNQCILMFAQPSFPHNCHRYIRKALGTLPK
ncbi:MAG TPA: CoA-binding protein [Desulfobacteria bacterium]|nr:CoA-binding protein [Desulfobacteria bacterium]